MRPRGAHEAAGFINNFGELLLKKNLPNDAPTTRCRLKSVG
jgi:hypothetical protein